MDDDEDQRPYKDRPEWKDVTPILQNDGPESLVAIKYPPGFEEAHNYFRAVQQKNEFSERSLKLTAHVIEHNSANYTAWYFRRRCLTELGANLDNELEFTNSWGTNSPKNYQVWYHRRWLIAEIAARIRKDAASEEEAAAEIRLLAGRELDFLLEVMRENDDYKNYNGWSHRQFVVQRFDRWDGELEFVELLLGEDVRNNSAWNHRYAVVRHEAWPPTAAILQREVDYTLAALRVSLMNESAWNYLGAFFGEGDGKSPWCSNASIESFLQEVVAATPDPGSRCRFAIEALARVHESKGEIGQALQQYELLKRIDKIRVDYWDWRASCLNATE